DEAHSHRHPGRPRLDGLLPLVVRLLALHLLRQVQGVSPSPGAVGRRLPPVRPVRRDGPADADRPSDLQPDHLYTEGRELMSEIVRRPGLPEVVRLPGNQASVTGTMAEVGTVLNQLHAGGHLA